MNGSDLWKWIAVSLATFLTGLLLASLPLALRTPNRDEFEKVRERQQMVLERLAAIDQRLDQVQEDIAANAERLDSLENILRQHIFGDGRAG